MQKVFLALIACALLFQFSFAQEMSFTKKASGKPELIQKGENKMWCPVCGMNLKMFYKTSHGVYTDDGDNRQYCSIRCLIQDSEHTNGHVTKTVVVDADDGNLIDVNNAYYVIGSKIMGTMTKTSKFAFSEMSEAEKFQSAYGGEIGRFADAKASAEKTMDRDVSMTDKKRKTKMYPMGEKILKTMCMQGIAPERYDTIAKMKADIKINRLCKPLKEKQLQAVALYLWDVQRKNSPYKSPENSIIVSKADKCPVCGMFVYKYPLWAAELNLSKNGSSKSLYFDGVKDLMKFYLEPEKWGTYTGIKINDIFVTYVL